MSKKIEQDTTTTRMYNADKSRFDHKADELGARTSAELIHKLLDIADAAKIPNDTNAENSIALTMSYFIGGPTPMYLPLKKIVFSGDIRYRPERMYHLPLTDAVWANLQDEFFNNNMPYIYQLEKRYSFYHVINLFYHQKEARYLVQEGLHIGCEYEYYDDDGHFFPRQLLDVWRCDFIDDYAELISKFSKYAHPDNLADIRSVLAENINEDYGQMEHFFPLRTR